MASIKILNPVSNTTKTITINMEASMIVQELLGEVEYFVTLSTNAKTVTGASIAKKNILSLTDGAGGTGLDRHGNALSGGKYASITDAINDHVALMVEGYDGQPDTAMSI